MTNSDYSPEDKLFEILSRAPYTEALKVWAGVYAGYSNNEHFDESVKLALEPIGWTCNDLYDYERNYNRNKENTDFKT